MKCPNLNTRLVEFNHKVNLTSWLNWFQKIKLISTTLNLKHNHTKHKPNMIDSKWVNWPNPIKLFDPFSYHDPNLNKSTNWYQKTQIIVISYEIKVNLTSWLNWLNLNNLGLNGLNIILTKNHLKLTSSKHLGTSFELN